MARIAATVLVLGAMLAGCAGSSIADDPVTALRDPERTTRTRVRAADLAWGATADDGAGRAALRETLKSLAWPAATPAPLRLRAMALLLSDPEAAEEARENARLMLPNERSREMVSLICSAAVEHGWTDFTPAIVRSFSNPVRDVPEEDRAERKALAALYPGEPIPEVVFGVFVDPRVEEGPHGIDWPGRTRADAWDLLTRLDPAGRYRWRLIEGIGEQAARASSVREVQNLRACVRDLRCLPQTSQELNWLTALRGDEPRNLGWWIESRTAIAATGRAKTERLELRHAEPIRWASVNRSAWVSESRDELYERALARLEGRQTHRRRAEITNSDPHGESLEGWSERLGWADLLTILVVDDALRAPGVAEDLFVYAGQDRADETTEYGGIIEPEGIGFAAVLYPPRASTRRGDDQFVASDDMIRASDRALAHYHFHVQKPSNQVYAGPSRGDLVYAARSGRTCVVLTSIDEDTLGVDVYQPNGVVIDLGELRR